MKDILQETDTPHHHLIGYESDGSYEGESHIVFMSEYTEGRRTDLPENKLAYCGECGRKIDWLDVGRLCRENAAKDYKERQAAEKKEAERFAALSPEEQKKELNRREERKAQFKLLSAFTKQMYGSSTIKELEDDISTMKQIYNALSK